MVISRLGRLMVKVRIKEIENKNFKEKTIKVLLDFLSSDSERSFVLP